MRIRSLTIEDLDDMSEIDLLCFPPEVAFHPEVFKLCLEDDSCECLGVDVDGLLAAFSVISFHSGGNMQIVTIDVLPECRRQGIADRLMKEIDKRAGEEDVERISLQVSVDNMPAIGLYRKWGFEARGVLDHYYGHCRHAYLMDRKPGLE